MILSTIKTYALAALGILTAVFFGLFQREKGQRQASETRSYSPRNNGKRPIKKGKRKRMKRLRNLSLVIGLGLMTGCSNPVKPAPLPIPDCPKYLKLSPEELDLLSQCKTDVCEIYRQTLIKLLSNHQESVACINEHRAVIRSTR